MSNEVHDAYVKLLESAINRLREAIRVEHWNHCDRAIAPKANMTCTCGNDVIRAALADVLAYWSKS